MVFSICLRARLGARYPSASLALSATARMPRTQHTWACKRLLQRRKQRRYEEINVRLRPSLPGGGGFPVPYLHAHGHVRMHPESTTAVTAGRATARTALATKHAVDRGSFDPMRHTKPLFRTTPLSGGHSRPLPPPPPSPCSQQTSSALLYRNIDFHVLSARRAVSCS